MVLAGLVLMVFNVISIARFVRNQHNILTGEGVAWLGYVALVLRRCSTSAISPRKIFSR